MKPIKMNVFIYLFFVVHFKMKTKKNNNENKVGSQDRGNDYSNIVEKGYSVTGVAIYALWVEY